MATHPGPVRRRAETADLQTDVTMARDSNHTIENHDVKLSTSIQSLPNEILALIFSHLSAKDIRNAACVCSRWRDITYVPSVWRHAKPFVNVDTLTPTHIQKINVLRIRKVGVEACSTMRKLKRFLLDLNHLEQLYLSIPLSLKSLYPKANKETLPKLTHFSIKTSLLSTQTLESFLQQMVNLQCLVLYCIPSRDFLRALKHSKHLVSLDIVCYQNEIEEAAPPAVDFDPISSLKRLYLNGIEMGESGLAFISKVFPQLNDMQLVLSTEVTPDGFKPLAKLKELRRLQITSEFIDDYLFCVLNHVSNLEHLVMKCSSNMDEVDQAEISDINRTTSLKYLILENFNVGDLGLDTISRAFPQLHCLEVMLSPRVTSNGLKSFAKLKHLGHLRIISEFFDGYFEQLLCVLQHLKQLLSLFIYVRLCACIKPEKLMGDPITVSSLKHFCLHGVSMGDSDLEFICRAFPQLCYLDLMLSPHVTSEWIKSLAKLEELRNLLITSKHIKDDWMEYFHTQRPKFVQHQVY